MLTFKKLGISFALVATLAFGFLPAASYAQDDMAVACDSTLVTLLLVAEHDYDYLSNMMDGEMGMPNVDLGQFSSLINSIIAMMQAMEMSEEDMAMMEAMQPMLDEMMMMSREEMLQQYDMDMGMEAMDDMTVLPPGNVAGENELCTTLRADVEKFLVAHILTEMQSIGDM